MSSIKALTSYASNQLANQLKPASESLRADSASAASISQSSPAPAKDVAAFDVSISSTPPVMPEVLTEEIPYFVG